jgi:uncharacterized protein (DUF427 family)
MGLNLARRASRSGATFRSDIEEVWLFEDVCVASGAIRKNSSIGHRAGRFKFLDSGGTTLLMRLSMGSDCIGFLGGTGPAAEISREAACKTDLMKRNRALGHQIRTEEVIFSGRKIMAKATWAGKTIADSNSTVVVEGNQYFPPEAVEKQFLKPSSHTSVCPWKGTAHYYHVEVDGMKNENAAWYYPEPKAAAAEIRDRIAFWKGVNVQN